jgi:hypothetical protein
MTLTPGYSPLPLHPRVIIKDLNDGTVYTFESEAIVSSPTQDFKLEAFKLHKGVNGDHGTLQLLIHDHDNVLTDSTNTLRPASIKREYSVQLYLGKTLATESRRFYGKIKDAIIQRNGTGIQVLSLTCVGWGIVLRERITRLVRNQKKLSDGITLDTTDTSTTMSALILDLFQDKDHYVDNNIAQISNITAAGTTDGTGIDTNDTGASIANVNYTAATFAQVISNLSGIANSTWHVDADRKLIVQDPSGRDSGFLFTNNLSSTEAQNWNSSKIGYILNAPLEWRDTSADTMYNFIHAFGHFAPSLNISDGQTPDAADNLDSAWHAIPITPTSDNISKIAIRSIKTGTMTTDGSVEIWGANGSSQPDPGDVRFSKILNSATLNALGTSTPADWFEIPINPKLKVEPDEILFIVFKQFGDASNTFSVNYKTATGTFWDSTDGTTWTSRTGQSAYRVYESKRLISTLEIVRTTQDLPEPKEKAFPVNSALEAQTVRETLLNVGRILGKQKRTYGKVIVSTPLDNIPIGTFCRLQDAKTGLLTNANITGIDMMGSSESDGVNRIELTLDSYQY